ncbi:MAG: CoA transferase [Dehalococcoidia bacterium]|nr:CoA transferase [Dehalococcoidia bacterium]MYD29747.1 CoA transferase [Dehalococcoidia bacterium]
MKAPLAGIRVVDLTMVWAGPFGTRLLGDYGAEVIKVEGPGQWDLLRGLGGIPRTVDRWYNRAAYFNHNNRNKYSAAIDLRQEAGRDLLLQLLAKSDVLVENYRANVMDNLGLSFEEVRAVNPRIVYVSMPGHGKTGPEAHYVTYGTNVEQLAGLVSVSGYEGGEPLKTGFSYGDPTAGLAVPAAVALGLRQRNRTGEGVHIDLAQRENLTGFVGEYLVDYSMNRELRAPAGNTHPHFAPHGVYPSGGEDRWITIACENDEQFGGLCRAMQQEELADDDRFATMATRKANERELDAIIEEWTSTWGHYEAMHILQRHGVPAGAVLTIPEVMSDPQLRARGAWSEQVHPDAGTWEVETPPWNLTRTPGHARIPAPGFAEHNSYVFRDLLGLDEETIARLYADGVTADEPNVQSHT